MKHNLLVGLLALSALAGCSKNPESVGKDIVNKTCDCLTKKADLIYKNSEQVQKDLSSGKYKTQQEVYAVMKQLNKEVMRSDSACMATPNALTTQAQVDFVKPDDQATFVNTMRANYVECQQKQAEKEKSRTPIDNNTLLNKLPFGEIGPAARGY